ncbi:MAG: bacterio-opsin activator [Aquificaceae bacterium]|nr:bacterio-opsin activator [Aquificaceae bacterium]
MAFIPKPEESEFEALLLSVFLKSVEVLGGFSKLAENKTLSWLPSLIKAVYCVVLKEEYFKDEEEIAKRVGLTTQTVRNLLRSDVSIAFEKLKSLEELAEEEDKELKVHTAGGIAKLAYKLVKEGYDEKSLSLKYCKKVAYAVDVPWAYMIMRRLKTEDFPISSPDGISERFVNVYILGRRAEEVFQELDYPINTPLELLHKIRENLRMYGLD